MALALGGCQSSVLDPRGPIGLAERTILIDSLAIMLAIVVPTIIATLGFAWWYRASNERARYLPEWSFSGRIELVVWAIPVLVVLLLGGVTWIGSYQLDPARPIESTTPALEIQVVSLDWKWLFIYPNEGVATVNQLVVPAGLSRDHVLAAFPGEASTSNAIRKRKQDRNTMPARPQRTAGERGVRVQHSNLPIAHVSSELEGIETQMRSNQYIGTRRRIGQRDHRHGRSLFEVI